jgi:hypothetical protein
MEFDDVIADLGDVSEQCASLIGKQHADQVDALTARIASLERELRERDDHIAILEDGRSQLASQLQNAESALEGIISRVRPRSASHASRLASLSERIDLSTKIQTVFTIIQKEHRTSKRLLASMLHGHVEFLTRLATTPELLSQFCVSSTSGKTFLPTETARLLLEQARRTSLFLGSSADNSRPGIGTVADALDLRIDLTNRFETVKNFLNTGELSALEINVLLLQELSITAALRRYAEQLREEVKVSEESRQAFRVVAKAIGREDSEFTPGLFVRFAKKLAGTVAQAQRARLSHDWEEWGRELYYAITGIEAGDVESADVQIAIEEGALTAVGKSRRRKRTR